jgi:hypothetical protein
MRLPLTLGQGFSQFADPEPLPSAPFFERCFLESPLPTAMGLTIAAMLGWWLLQRWGRIRDSWLVAAACVALAGGTMLLARLVVTQREALVQHTTELVNATIDANPDAVAPFLREDVTVILLGNDQPSMNGATALLKRIGTDKGIRDYIEAAHLRWVTATLDGPNTARTQCRVAVDVKQWGIGVPTTWMLHWSRRDEHSPWQVRIIEAQQISTMQPHSIGNI